MMRCFSVFIEFIFEFPAKKYIGYRVMESQRHLNDLVSAWGIKMTAIAQLAYILKKTIAP